MTRPEFLHCPMTPEIIRSIRDLQSAYDADPEEYERRQRQRREEYEREQQELAEQQRKEP